MQPLTSWRRSSRISSRARVPSVAGNFAASRGISLEGDETAFDQYQYDFDGYAREFLGWEPYNGSEAHPGQQQIVNQYLLSLHQQHEKEAFDNGRVTAKQLRYWQPGTVIQNRIHVEAGHTVGKTKVASGLVNHFYDCFLPSIIYTFAPSEMQLKTLLWKEIRTDRLNNARLPGRVGPISIADPKRPDHFAVGRVANDSLGTGTERVQGQHGRYLLFVLDEAEGIPEFIFDAVDSMLGGGIGLMLMIANPKTRASRFYRERRSSRVATFRISCLYHPNVMTGKEIVPDAVKRSYVEGMLESGMNDRGLAIVPTHDADAFTFSIPYSVLVNGHELPPGTIFRPDAEFLWRVMGIPPLAVADKTLISVARYEAAKAREVRVTIENTLEARIGVDVARYGSDYGTIYSMHKGIIQRERQLFHADTNEYREAIVTTGLKLAAAGATTLSVRVDGTGGFGAGTIDAVKGNLELRAKLQRVITREVQFGGSARSGEKYANKVTELYAEANESILGVTIRNVPNELETDLTSREAEFVNRSGRDLRQLEAKERFRKREGRSPDDGDGFVLCVNPESLFDVYSDAAESVSYSMFN